MKRWTITLIGWLYFCFISSAQVGINPGNNPPDPSAGLDIDFSDKGLLVPRLTGDEILAISDPSVGLIVYNLSAGKPVYFTGFKWKNLDGTTAWFHCGDPLEVIHGASAVAPVNKTVSYGTISNIVGEPTKCWMSMNLGSGQQASGVNDTTETSAGWYWQFNRKQGYKHDGDLRTPTAEWETSISENSDWLPVNDPCFLELGIGWRIPTHTEWINVSSGSGGNWMNWEGPWNSPLHIHAAGFVDIYDGALSDRGAQGYYWSGTQSEVSGGWSLWFNNSACIINIKSKAYGLPVRCIQTVD